MEQFPERNNRQKQELRCGQPLGYQPILTQVEITALVSKNRQLLIYDLEALLNGKFKVVRLLLGKTARRAGECFDSFRTGGSMELMNVFLGPLPESRRQALKLCDDSFNGPHVRILS